MNTKLNYVACEEGVSQYDDYDFETENIVPAKYVKARLIEDEGNPFIEALPYPRSEKGVLSAYSKSLPSYNFDKVKSMSTLDKMLQINMLRSLRFPLPFHNDLEFNLYNALLVSYRARRRVLVNNVKLTYIAEEQLQETTSILTGNSSDATNAGFSLIGYSGCGKSSAISTLVSHYPQVIMHSDGNDGHFPQITYLVVNCVANSNFAALYEGIGDAIDKAFGNVMPVYAKEVARTSNLGKKAEKIREYVEKFAIGIIIFDEIQLIDFEHTKENTYDSLMTLANRTKVAVAVVGTEDARDKMFKELRTARRIGTMINGNLYCNNRGFFNVLVKNLFRYQWFDTPVQITNDIIDALYEVSKGIIDQLIGVYSCMNIDYIKSKKKPSINGDYVRAVAKKYYPGIQNVLANLETDENERELENIRANAQLRINELFDEEKQKQEVERIMKENVLLVENNVQLSNVVTNIRALYDEFSDNQIETAYKKVMAKSISVGKTEREISRLVIEQLQKVPKRRVSKSKINAPDTEHMLNFLGIDNEVKYDTDN